MGVLVKQAVIGLGIVLLFLLAYLAHAQNDKFLACRATEELTPLVYYDPQSQRFIVLYAFIENSTTSLYVQQYNLSWIPDTFSDGFSPSLRKRLTLEDAYYPSLVRFNSTYYVAYSTSTDAIYLNAYDTNWNLLTSINLTGNSSLQESEPSLAFANGFFYLAYQSFETGKWHIFLKTLNLSLGVVNKTQLTSGIDGELSPSLVILNNSLYLAYASYANSTSGVIFANVYDESLNLSQTFVLSNSSEHSLFPFLLQANNKFYATSMKVSTDVIPQNWDIFLDEYDLNFTLLSAKQFTNDLSDQANPSLAVVNQTAFIVYATQEKGMTDVKARWCTGACIKPDIQVSSVVFDTEHEPGQLGYLFGSVANTGTVPSGYFTVEFLADGISQENKTLLLQGNTAQTVNFSWTPLLGLHELTVRADPGNDVNESDEGNNNGSTSYGAIQLSLVPGQNLISSPFMPANASLLKLAEKLGNFTIIWSYNSSDSADPWKSYDPSAPDFANDLERFDPQYGYWVNMSMNKTLYLTGSQSSFAYELSPGWNLLGYPNISPATPQYVQENFFGHHKSYSVVWAYNASEVLDPLKVFNPYNASQQDLTSIEPGLGYWVYLPDADNDGISDGQEKNDYFRQERIESEDYATSNWNPNTLLPAADLYQFGVTLKATSGIPFAYGFSEVNLTLPIQKPAWYRLSTEGAGRVEFREFFLEELCDFDAERFAGEVILNAPIMNITRFGVPWPIFREERNWTHRMAGTSFIEYFKTVSHEVSWRLSGEFLLTPGNYTISFWIKLPPRNVSAEFQPYANAGAVIALNISNSFFVLEKLGLNDTDNDTDADQVSDGTEFFSGMYPLNTDPDEDGLSDARELGMGLDPELRDTDFDWLLDSVELGLSGNDSDTLTPWDTVLPDHGAFNTKPNLDGDAGLTTTDPLDRDSDHDGLPDGWVDGWAFILGSYDTQVVDWGDLYQANNPLNLPAHLLAHERWEGEDFDRDGIVDGGAWNNGTLFSSGETDPNVNDTDNDTLPDAWEAYYRINPLVSIGLDGPFGDADVLAFEVNETPVPDGLTNLDEYTARTHPRSPDTDSDGLFDGQEAGTVIFRTNVPDGAREFTSYSTVNLSGQAEWLWFNNTNYTFEATLYAAPEFFTVQAFLYDTFILGETLENLTFIASLEDYSYLFLNKSQDRMYACSGLTPVCHMYTATGAAQMNAMPALSYKNRELYLSGPLTQDTDGDGIIDNQEPLWSQDSDGDGVANVRDLDADDDAIPDWYENTALVPGAGREFTPTDTDGDGFLDMVDTDSDSDGLSDFEERPFFTLFMPRENITSHLDPDTDHDGLLDGNNITAFTNTTVYTYFTSASKNIYFTQNPDTSVTFAGELSYRTDPLDADTDDDRLVDGATRRMSLREFQGQWFGELSIGTNATDYDTDEDTIADGAEVWGWPVHVQDIDGNVKIITGSSNPRNGGDSDADGIPDVQEAFIYNGNSSDTDGDCLSDGVEDANKNLQLDPGETSPVMTDSDRDYLPDGRLDFNGNSSYEAFEQEDGNCDGIVDGSETNPKDPDSDHDGLVDGLELKVVIFRTNVEQANYSSLDTWIAADVGEEKLVRFRATDLDVSMYLPGRKLAYRTPEGFEIYYNRTREIYWLKKTLFIKNGTTLYNFTWDGDLEPEKAYPTGQYAAGEVFLSLGNPLLNDTDNDNLSDGAEFYNLSRFTESYLVLFDVDNDTLNSLKDDDADNDLVRDADDLWHTTNQTIAPYYNSSTAGYWERFYSNDFDGDSLPNGIDRDSDNDTAVNASWTDGGEDTNHDGRRQEGELNPLGDDADQDGIKDSVELSYGLNILNPDTDHDGIPDGRENQWSATIDEDSAINARDPDSDGDGLLDGQSQTVNASNSTYDAFLGKTVYAFFVEHNISFSNITNDTVLFPGELSLSTDPYEPDTDNDGVWDGYNPVTAQQYEGDITIGKTRLNTKSSFFSTYSAQVISQLPLRIYGELSLGTDPRRADSDNDGISDGDEQNGYFIHDLLVNCGDYTLSSYAPLRLSMAVIEPGDYLLSLRTRPINEYVGAAGPLEVKVFNVSGQLVANFTESYDAHVFRIDTEYYPYQPGYASAYGILSYYTHNFNLPNVQPGMYEVELKGSDLIILDNDILILKRGGLNATNPDTDNDTLSDGRETYNLTGGRYETAPGLEDTDSDGIADGNDTLPGVIPAEPYYFINVDLDGDDVWDKIDFNPDSTVSVEWTNLFPPGAIEFNSTYRVWGFKGAGCQDKNALTDSSLFSDCLRNAGPPHDWGGRWIEARGLALSDVNSGKVKDDLNKKSLKSMSFTAQAVSEVQSSRKALHSISYPYHVYHPWGYYPSYKIFYEPTYWLYDANIENHNTTTLSLNDQNFHYALTNASLFPDKRQEFVIQFSVSGREGYIEDEHNYRLPFFMYALYNGTFDEDNLVYRNLARSTILDAVTCGRRPYEARLIIPKEFSQAFTEVLLYVSPFWIETKEGYLKRIPIAPSEIRLASLGHTYTKYAYTIIANLTDNLSLITNATPEDIQNYSTGLYTFSNLSFSVLKDDGDDDVEIENLFFINQTFYNQSNTSGFVIISDNEHMVDVYVNRIDWPPPWHGNTWIDNTTIGGISLNRVGKVKNIKFSFVKYEDLKNIPAIVRDSEDEDDDEEGEVKYTLARIGVDTEYNKFEASVSINRKKKLDLDISGTSIFAIKDVKKTAQKIKGSYEEAIDQALQAGMLKDEAYENAMATHNKKFRSYADQADRLGKLKKVGEVLLTSENVHKAVLAYKKGDQLEVSYYAIRAGLDVAEVVFDSSFFAKSVGGVKVYPPRLGMKIATSFEVAKGAAEMGYLLIKAGQTKDPIAQHFLYEDAAGAGVGIGLSIASYFYPPLMVVDPVYAATAGLVSKLSPCDKEKLGCRLAERVSSFEGAVVFIGEVLTGQIPATIVQDAFSYAKISLLGGEYQEASALGYIALYNDPAYTARRNETVYPQLVIKPEVS